MVPLNPSDQARPTETARRAVLAAVLLLAAGLRFTRLGLVEFKYDEATTVRQAIAIAREGRLPIVGMISSQGPHNPPLFSYALAPPFALSRDPRLGAAWLALLGVGAVALTFWLGNSFFGWPVGAISAALFAASPWAVFHSRKLWTQNLPLLTLTFIALVLSLVVRHRSWALAPALAAVGALIGLHLGGLVFVFVALTVLALFRHRLRLLPFLVGVGLLLLLLSPYLIHDATHGWRDMNALFRMTSSTPSFNLQAPTMAARVASGRHFEDLAGTRQAEFLSSIPDLHWLDQLEISLFWFGLAWSAFRVAREVITGSGSLSPDAQARTVLLCWFLIPVALLTQRASVQPHDFNLLYPVQHLFIALLLVDVARWASSLTSRQGPIPSHVVAPLAIVPIATLLIWQLYYQQALLAFVDQHHTIGGHGAPLKDTLAAARRAEDLAVSTGAELIVLLPGDEPRFHGPAAVFDALLDPRRRRLIDGREALVLPANPTTYLVHPETSSHAASLLAEWAAEAGPPLPVRDGSPSVYRFFRFQPGPVSARIPLEVPPRWPLPSPSAPAAHVTLLGYHWSGDARPGGTIDWTLVWRVDGSPPSHLDLHWFNHLVGQREARWGQKDGVGVPISSWRDGDSIFTWFSIPIDAEAPSPPYHIRTGLYTYPDVVNVPVITVSGAPPAQYVELGPIGAAP